MNIQKLFKRSQVVLIAANTFRQKVPCDRPGMRKCPSAELSPQSIGTKFRLLFKERRPVRIG
jgi:hypothetical protein